MILSTFPIAVIVVGLIYFLVIRKLRWRWLAYCAPLAIAALFMSGGAVHLVYVGLQTAALGFIVARMDPMRYLKKKV